MKILRKEIVEFHFFFSIKKSNHPPRVKRKNRQLTAERDSLRHPLTGPVTHPPGRAQELEPPLTGVGGDCACCEGFV